MKSPSSAPHPPISRAMRALLSVFSAPRVDMREDYGKVRRLQRRLASLTMPWLRTPYRQTVAKVEGRPVTVRIFQPAQRLRDDVLLFFHGGGWVTGDIDSYSPACATMADLTGCVVASVNYRLAPEHPFPAGLSDCYGIAQQVLADPQLAGIQDGRRVVLVGDSAGANLAAVVSLLLAERGQRGPRRQILLYPVTHWDHDPATTPFASVREHGSDYRLTSAEINAYFDLYVPDPSQRQSQLVAPLLAADLAGQPATLVLTAELDLLCDEGEAYGRALAAAGNSVQIHRVLGALHGFIQLPRISRHVREAYEVINSFLDEGVATEPAATEPAAAGPDAAGSA